MTRMRLDAYLSRCGMGSRSETKRIIKRGRVTIETTVCKNAKQIVDAECIAVDGDTIVMPPSDIHCILHKPCGHACSHDPFEDPIIYDLLPPEWMGSGVQSAGRLDRETSGLLVITTDGQRTHSLIHPKKKIAKRYRITYTGTLCADAVEQCTNGLELEDEKAMPCLPAQLEVHGEQQATMIIYEGRYHQVRKMIAALGGHVTALHRDKIGNFELPTDLAVGEIRHINDADWLEILHSEVL